MSPNIAAELTLKDYFAHRNEAAPDVQARELIRRIRLFSNGRWGSDTLVDTACRVLETATFDVDDLVENHLGIGLSIEPLEEFDSRTGSAVFGLADPPQWEMVICERALRYLPLYRTCVAHELGHLLLHSSAGRRERQLAFSPGAPNRPPEEREADEFMAALLAPRHVLFLGVALAAEQSDLHVSDVFRRADTTWGLDVWRHSILPCMIDRLCLSREFIAVQMSKWRVFSSETVEYHKTYRLPNRWRQ